MYEKLEAKVAKFLLFYLSLLDFPANIMSFWAGSPIRGHASVGRVQIPAPHSHVSQRCIVPFCHPLLCIRAVCTIFQPPRLYSVIQGPRCTLSSFGANSQQPSAVTSHARNITIRQMLARHRDTKVHLDTHPQPSTDPYFHEQGL